MRLTVAGYWGGFPARNEATAGYLLEAEGFSLLMDCGSGVLSKLQNFITLESLDAVWLSHYHHDHMADIGPLYYARLVKGYLGQVKRVLPIYGHTLDKDSYNKLSHPNVTKAIGYSENDHLQIGPFELSFLKTKHPVPCFAVRLTYQGKHIVYTADSSFFPELIDFSTGADLLIAECSLYEDQDGKASGHLTSKEVGQLAKQSNVKKILLTHLPHYGDHNELVNSVSGIFSGEVDLAKTGWVWEA